MEKTVNVTSITKKTGAKGVYLAVTFTETATNNEFTRNVFDKIDQANCELSLKDGVTMVATLVQKGDFENVTKVVPFTSPTVKVAPVSPTDETLKQAEVALGEARKPPIQESYGLSPSDKAKYRAMAASFTKDEIVAGLTDPKGLTMRANEYFTYIESGRI